MKIDILEDNSTVIRFVLKDSNTVLANSIRRAAINSVKTFAIDKITFYENTSAMFDEYIAHRVGLIPIKTPAKGYDEKDEILFTLDETGPKTVYSGDLLPSDKEVKVTNDKIPIIKLADSQRLRLDGKAILGTAANHAKFQPGLITYEIKGNSYEFYVETFGQMSPREIINKTFESIKEEVKEIHKQAKDL